MYIYKICQMSYCKIYDKSHDFIALKCFRKSQKMQTKKKKKY